MKVCSACDFGMHTKATYDCRETKFEADAPDVKSESGLRNFPDGLVT